MASAAKINNSRFISLEGGEGVGKSTLARGLLEWLSQRGEDCIHTREPGGTPVADAIRSIFMLPTTNETLLKETELCLVSAARAQHVHHTIKPALAAGKWVICDRFSDSSRVYQQSLGQIPKSITENIIALTTYGAAPALTFLLDCPVEVSMQRLQGRAGPEEKNRYDKGSMQLHQNIRQAFLNIAQAEPERFVILDATKDPEILIQEAVAVLESRL